MEHSLYLNGLKQALKAHGITYAELAGTLKMTESGVKKMLNAKDISFRRVLQICESINVMPGQLFSLSEQTEIPEITLSPEQQEALIKSRPLLAVYWRLAIEKRETAEIERLEKMNAADLKKILQRLVSLKLLKHSRGQYRSLHGSKFRWADDSRLAKYLNREWSELTLRRSLTDDLGLHRLSSLRMKKESYQELQKKISAIFDEAAQISEREEMSLKQRELTNITMLVAAVPRGVLDADKAFS